MDGSRRGGEWDRERGGVGNGTRWGKGGRGGEKKLTCEVIVMTDFPITVIKWMFTVVAGCGVGIL